VRFAVTVLLWLATTACAAVAVFATWTQNHVVNEDGYAALASQAANDPQVHAAVASMMTTRAMALSRERGRTDDPNQMRFVADAYAASPAFPKRFVEVNRAIHRWAFNRPAPDSQGPLQIDVAPMLREAFLQVGRENISAGLPASVYVRLAESDRLRPGQFEAVGRWTRPVAVCTIVLAGLFALLTLAAARSRGKALASLGVSALLIGGAGWAVTAVVAGRIGDALNRTSADMHAMAGVIIADAEANLHRWLVLTLAVGGGLVVIGVIVAIVEGRVRRHRASRSASGAGTRISMPT
jgi:hypothetical protein